MSSNIRIRRICLHCKQEFEARTTVTRYCGDTCAKRAYKARKRKIQVEQSQIETRTQLIRPLEELKAKAYLSITDACGLLGISRWTVTRLVKKGELPAAKFGSRILLKRTDLDDRFFALLPTASIAAPIASASPIPPCYTLAEIRTLYGISEKALYELIKRNQIPQFQLNRRMAVPIAAIQQIFGEPLIVENHDKSKTSLQTE